MFKVGSSGPKMFEFHLTIQTFWNFTDVLQIGTVVLCQLVLQPVC